MKKRRPRSTPLGPEFQMTSLTAQDRYQIVEQTSDWAQAGTAYALADDFELSALGATLSITGNWPDSQSGLVQWRQETSQGRDQYVKVVHRGYLFPTGHRAVLIQIVERVFVEEESHPGLVVAYLQLIEYIRILQPSKTYPTLGQSFGGRGWPFTTVRITATTSPLLAGLDAFPLPKGETVPAPTGMWGFPFTKTATPTSIVNWPMVVTDASGRTISLRMPLVFVEANPVNAPTYKDSPYDAAAFKPLCEAYNKLDLTSDKYPRVMYLQGNKVRFALELGSNPGGASFATPGIILGAATTTYDPNTPATSGGAPSAATLAASDQPAFYPTISSARIKLAAVEALTKGSFTDGDDPLDLGGVGIVPYGSYLENATSGGYGTSNKGHVWAALSSPPDLTFGNSGAVGGIGTPNSTLTGVSATAGAVGGGGKLDTYAKNGALNPSEYFGSIAANILGGLPLGSILKGFLNTGTLPTITDEVDSSGNRTVTYELQAMLQETTVKEITFTPDPSGNQTFTLNAVAYIPTSGPSTYQVTGSIDPFSVELAILNVPFTSMTFTSSSGTKPDVNAQIGNITFEGPLSFLNTLEQFLQDMGGSGFSVSVTPSGITATFSISLPSIGVGVVNIQGLGLTAGVTIPFLGGSMLVDFGFASQENPFTVTVMCFGGGGYFAAGFGIQGVQTLTVSIQFEGQLALDIGVASGGITLAAGFTFSLDASPAPGSTTLTAFVQLTGSLNVLGIISVTIELDLQLSYASMGGTNYLTGTATLSIDVSIFFFSVSVSVQVQKQFAGGSSDPAIERGVAGRALAPHATPPTTPAPYPAFGDVMSQTDWTNYCSSFSG
ncbi:MAG: hypothetical protein ACLQK4_03090 [Acidimicrobiales bacterium]|jgi:hypothetical protein